MKIKFHYNRSILKTGAFLAILVFTTIMADAQNSKVTLNVGDPAPAIKVFKWVKGTPVESFNKDKIYVLEFWATWCGPCKAAMPHLSELARKFAGKVTITGVDVWEKKGQPQEVALPAVASFVKQMGSDMDYNVAMDNNNQDMANHWMVAAGLGGIPATFLIKDGKIAWIGHPMNLEPILAEVIAGTYNSKAFADKYNKQSVDQQKERAEIEVLLKPIQQARLSKDYLRVLVLIDSVKATITSKYPMYKGGIENMEFEALVETDLPAALAFAREWHKTSPGWANVAVPKLFSEKEGLPKEAYKMGADYMTDLLSSSNAVLPLCYEMIATCYFKMGDPVKAVASQKKALELARDALKEGKYKGSILEETVTRFQASLEKYRSAVN